MQVRELFRWRITSSSRSTARTTYKSSDVNSLILFIETAVSIFCNWWVPRNPPRLLSLTYDIPPTEMMLLLLLLACFCALLVLRRCLCPLQTTSHPLIKPRFEMNTMRNRERQKWDETLVNAWAGEPAKSIEWWCWLCGTRSGSRLGVLRNKGPPRLVCLWIERLLRTASAAAVGNGVFPGSPIGALLPLGRASLSASSSTSFNLFRLPSAASLGLLQLEDKLATALVT